MMNQNDEAKPARVAGTTPPKQAGEATPPGEPWWWVERAVWTERMLTRLTSGEPANRNGLRAVDCCPWQRPTSGRGQS